MGAKHTLWSVQIPCYGDILVVSMEWTMVVATLCFFDHTQVGEVSSIDVINLNWGMPLEILITWVSQLLMP